MGKEIVYCDHCGAELERYPSEINERNYCDTECMNADAPQPSGEDHALYSKQTVECAACGAALERQRHRIEANTNHFCDMDCKGHWERLRVEVKCAWCQEPLQRMPSRVDESERQFCDNECRGAWMEEHQRGPAHPRWKENTNDLYGDTWRIQRRAARARDGYRCWLCGIDDRLNKALTGRELSVHHVRRKENFPTLKQANRLGNLLTVCDACHNALHALFRDREDN